MIGTVKEVIGIPSDNRVMEVIRRTEYETEEEFWSVPRVFNRVQTNFGHEVKCVKTHNEVRE